LHGVVVTQVQELAFGFVEQMTSFRIHMQSTPHLRLASEERACQQEKQLEERCGFLSLLGFWSLFCFQSKKKFCNSLRTPEE